MIVDVSSDFDNAMFESTLKPTHEAPTSPATHATLYTDDEEEEKKSDDDVPLLSSEAIVSSGKLMLRRRGNPLSFRRKKKDKSPSRLSTSSSPKGQNCETAKAKLVEDRGSPPSTELVSSAKAADTPSNKPRFNLGGLGRRLSSRRVERRGSDSKKEQEITVRVIEPEDEDEIPVVEQDPVIQIFESRNKQRVRFALEGNDEAKPPTNSDVPKEDIEDGSPEDGKASGTNIKQFMSRALFGSTKPSIKWNEEMKAEVANLGDGSLVWENSAETDTGPGVVQTHKNPNAGSGASKTTLNFSEDSKVRGEVEKLLEKARKAEHLHFRYEYGVKCYLKVLNLLKEAKYPDDHPSVSETVDMLNNAHHVLSSYNNSANIVKMGIKYEDAGELVRALKMYTIAYRIRRDNLSRNHPSLVVLLNMLGSIQIKRGELQEAMQIYELALVDSPSVASDSKEKDQTEKPTSNLLAKSVTYREMGVIFERWGKIGEALHIYHKSLECVMEWKHAVREEVKTSSDRTASAKSTETYSIKDLRLAKAVSDRDGSDEDGEMEVFIPTQHKISPFGVTKSDKNMYESFFPAELESELEKTDSSPSSSSKKSGRKRRSKQDTHADMDLSLTLHQIAQLHRSQGEFARALDAYIVALRGMKYALGKHHPNVAAVLGNIGNLQKEMNDLDAAFATYQEVLGIESYRLGLSHPDVAITLHNIATIDAARGNYDHALQLYRKVIGLEKKLFGDEHISVAVAAACMGDVYEKIGEYTKAVESYEEAVRIKSLCLGRHSVDVARLLHKLGKLAFLAEDFHMGESFVSRALLMYRLNKIDEEHPWMVDANRDSADIDAALAMGRGRQFEC